MRQKNLNMMIGLFVAVVFGLSGCGGGGGGGGGGDVVSPTTPTASDVSLSADSTTSVIQKQLIGSAPNGDTLTYELISPASGVGYSAAYVTPTAGMLYINVDTSYDHKVSLQYRVTNGKVFSTPATITIDVRSSTTTDKDLGKNDVAPKDYALYPTDYSTGDVYGTPGAAPTIPQKIDLSANFPTPGYQGNQSSCVGWATAYALKSYQERLEYSWSLYEWKHLFSPAFIYNQINGGQDKGSFIPHALQLVVNKGAATLATMPYIYSDYLSTPSSLAFAEASNYKAYGYSKVQGFNSIKAQLANKRPVVAGISVYSSFLNLNGANPVYNTIVGSSLGGHAVTIVGYDDSKYGGAFKIINSWGTSWGDKGYFWIPYTFVSAVLNEAYILIDTPSPYAPPPDIRPPPTASLPNLTVTDWKTTYDPYPGGGGSLQYEVKNNGTSDAALGFDVCLMLSKTSNLKDTGIFVVCEQSPFSLEPGAAVYRDDQNLINFKFPQSLAPGIYYMSVWVDDLNIIQESIENDNWGFGSNTVPIVNSKPDLAITSWYANWDNYYNAVLTYNVENNGTVNIAGSIAEVALVLVGNGTQYILYKEKYPSVFLPNHYVFRDDTTPAYFRMNYTWDSLPVPPGNYDVAFIADPYDILDESDEANNVSLAWDKFTLVRNLGKVVIGEEAQNTNHSMYNGKVLPSPTVRKNVAALNKTSRKTAPLMPSVSSDSNNHIFSKEMRSSDTEISPTTVRHRMPSVPAPQQK